MFAPLSNLRHTFVRLQSEWENLMWQCSEERQEMATMRLEAHELAMEEGYQSPYTDPDDYNIIWEPIVKRYREVDTDTPE